MPLYPQREMLCLFTHREKCCASLPTERNDVPLYPSALTLAAFPAALSSPVLGSTLVGAHLPALGTLPPFPPVYIGSVFLTPAGSIHTSHTHTHTHTHMYTHVYTNINTCTVHTHSYTVHTCTQIYMHTSKYNISRVTVLP